MNSLDELRINKLREYLLEVLDGISKSREINADALSKEVNCYSLDKIPTASTVETWITGLEIHKDVFSFRSRRNYSYNAINNLLNIGFFEMFEQVIRINNREGILPDIEGIEKIECLNCGTMLTNDTNTAEFDIQIQITYRFDYKQHETSL